MYKRRRNQVPSAPQLSPQSMQSFILLTACRRHLNPPSSPRYLSWCLSLGSLQQRTDVKWGAS